MINRLVTPVPRLTVAERRALRPLRAQYQITQDMFTVEELARLRFLRWLVESPRWDTGLDRPAGPVERPTWMPGSIA